jgi:hypothetical protein
MYSLVMVYSGSNPPTTVEGLADTYAVSNGKITVLDPREVAPLLSQGWMPALTPNSVADQGFTLANLAANATANTYGTAGTLSPGAGYTSMGIPASFDIVFGNLGTELITANIVVNKSDGTNVTNASYTSNASNTTTVLTAAQLRALLGTLPVSPVNVTNIQVSMKSNIANSTATLGVNAHGRVQ